MLKLNLQEYKNNKIFFLFYDVILKDIPMNKDIYLKNIGITPSSYRRSRLNNQGIGSKIISTLNENLKYQEPTDELIDNIQDKFNQIYYDMYFKNYHRYDAQMQYLDDLLDNNYNIFPIIKLFKLFMIINSQKDAFKIIEDNKEEYKEILKYKSFFVSDLLQILDILTISFEDEITNEILAKDYINNGLIYFLLSSKLAMQKRYIESLYFCNKAKAILESENNYKRLINLNLVIMFSLNYIGSYEQCYELAFKQYITLQAFSISGFEYISTLKHLIAAAMGLKKYNKVLEYLKEENSFNLSSLLCYFVSIFNINQSQYIEELNKYKKQYLENNEISSFLNLLDLYLSEKDKNALLELSKYKIAPYLTYIIK